MTHLHRAVPALQEEAVGCLHALIDFARSVLYPIEQVEPDGQQGELRTYQWRVSPPHGLPPKLVSFPPDDDRARAVLAAWQRFSAKRLHNDLHGQPLVMTATATFLMLIETGVLQVQVLPVQ